MNGQTAVQPLKAVGTGSADCQMRETSMPVISKFYGIVIRMLQVRAFAPRFHAIYEDSELVVELWPLRVIQGTAPGRVRDLVLEWAGLHQQELLNAWNMVQTGHPPFRIAPLQ